MITIETIEYIIDFDTDDKEECVHALKHMAEMLHNGYKVSVSEKYDNVTLYGERTKRTGRDKENERE